MEHSKSKQMKSYLLRSLIIVLVISCNKRKNDSFTLSGKIEGNYDSYIYLKYEDQIDSVLVMDSKFRFTGKTTQPTQSSLSTGSPNSKEQTQLASFMLENSQINVTLKLGNMNLRGSEIKTLDIESISGSNAQKIKDDFEHNLEKTFYKKEDSIKAKLLFHKLNEFVTKNPTSELAGNYVARLNGFYGYLNADQLEMLLEKMDTTYQTKNDLFKINSMISREEILRVGSNPPKVELPNREGRYINSKMFEGKLVLLEFWASWCAPCRSMNPELLKVYNEFSRENFEILGISIDKDKTAWKKAIEEDKLEWTQTIDSTREIIKSFKISGIPFNVLLNRNGKIISTDLKPNELRKIIESKI